MSEVLLQREGVYERAREAKTARIRKWRACGYSGTSLRRNSAPPRTLQ